MTTCKRCGMTGLKWEQVESLSADGSKRWVLYESESMVHSGTSCRFFKQQADAEADPSSVTRPTLRIGDRVEVKKRGWKATVTALSKPLEKAERTIDGKGQNLKGDRFAKLRWDPYFGRPRGMWINTRALRKIEADANA